MKSFFLFSQMPQFRVEKICAEHMHFQVFKRAGENVVLEDTLGDCVYFVTRGLFVSQKTVTVDSLNFWPRSPSSGRASASNARSSSPPTAWSPPPTLGRRRRYKGRHTL